MNKHSIESCGSCNSDIYPSTEYAWHWPDEDCRSIKEPHTEAQWLVYATSPRWSGLRKHDSRFASPTAA